MKDLIEALHDHWQNNVKTWEQTKEKLPGQANFFFNLADKAIEAAEYSPANE